MTVQGINKNIIVQEMITRLNLLFLTMQNAVLSVVNENNNEFDDEVNKFRDNIATIVLENTIGENLESLFNSYDLVGKTAQDRFLMDKELFQFGTEETMINSNEDLTISLNTLDINIRINALALAYDNSTNVEYGNTDELEVVISDLEAEYDSILENDIDSDTRIALLDLKTRAIGFLSNLELKDVVEINTFPIPSTVLSYQYYKDSFFADNIISLNNINNTGFIEGTIKILSTN